MNSFGQPPLSPRPQGGAAMSVKAPPAAPAGRAASLSQGAVNNVAATGRSSIVQTAPDTPRRKVVIASIPRLPLGCVVKRNPASWKWGDQDGGDGRTGVVVADDPTGGYVTVRWYANNVKNHYRYGYDYAQDVMRSSSFSGFIYVPRLGQTVRARGSDLVRAQLEEHLAQCFDHPRDLTVVEELTVYAEDRADKDGFRFRLEGVDEETVKSTLLKGVPLPAFEGIAPAPPPPVAAPVDAAPPSQPPQPQDPIATPSVATCASPPAATPAPDVPMPPPPPPYHHHDPHPMPSQATAPVAHVSVADSAGAHRFAVPPTPLAHPTVSSYAGPSSPVHVHAVIDEANHTTTVHVNTAPGRAGSVGAPPQVPAAGYPHPAVAPSPVVAPHAVLPPQVVYPAAPAAATVRVGDQALVTQLDVLNKTNPQEPKLLKVTLKGDISLMPMVAIKKSLEAYTGLPADLQVLEKDGVRLADDATAGGVGLRMGSVLTLLLRPAQVPPGTVVPQYTMANALRAASPTPPAAVGGYAAAPPPLGYDVLPGGAAPPPVQYVYQVPPPAHAYTPPTATAATGLSPLRQHDAVGRIHGVPHLSLFP